MLGDQYRPKIHNKWAKVIDPQIKTKAGRSRLHVWNTNGFIKEVAQWCSQWIFKNARVAK